MQGLRILRNEAHLAYVAVTKDEALRGRWAFYFVVKFVYDFMPPSRGPVRVSGVLYPTEA